MEIEVLLKRIYVFLISPRGKKCSLYAAMVFAVFVVAGLLLPHLYSQDYLKNKLKIAAQQRLGREVTVAGNIKARVFPWPGIDANNITIANPPLYDGALPLANIRAMHIDFSLSGLLLAHIEAKSVEFVGANINLYNNQSGRPNWLFGDNQPGLQKWRRQFNGAGYNNVEQVLYLIKALPYNIMPADVILSDSSINYLDEATQQSFSFTEINNRISLDQTTQGLSIKGSGTWNHEDIDWFMSASNKAAFETKERSSIKMSYASKAYNISLTGSIERDIYSGRANLLVTSLRDTMPWLSEYEPFSSIVSPLEFSLNADAVECGRSFCNFNGNFQLDSLRGRSNTRFSYGTNTPKLTMNLEIKQANLSPFFVPPQSKNALPLPPGHKEEIKVPEKNWSTVPFNFDALGLSQANITLQTKQLTLHDIKFGRGSIQLTADDKSAELNITDMEMYSGKGTINVKLDKSQAPYKWRSVINLSDANIDSIMNYWMGIRGFQGKSNLLLNIASEGDTPQKIISSSDGNGILHTKNGRIRGADLPSMFRNISKSFEKPLPSKYSTDFDTLNANLTVKKGVLINDDLSVESGLLQFTGKGIVDFANYRIDYLLTPQKVIKLDNSAGAGNKVNYPIMVSGPLNNPDFIPNLKNPIRNHGKSSAETNESATPKNVAPESGKKPKRR